MRGSPEASIVGGTLLLVLDLCGIAEGCLPLKGRFDTAVDAADNPEIFWIFAVALDLIGAAAVLWGLMRRE